MSDPQIIVSARGTIPRLALLEGELPVELRLFPPDARPFTGELLNARVIRVAREINAAFLLSDAGELLLPYEKVKSGTARKTRSISDCVHEGESIAVQVIREADPADGKLAVARLAADSGGDCGDKTGLAGLIAEMAGKSSAGIIIDERKLYLAVKRLSGQDSDITLWTGHGGTDERDIFEEFQIQEVLDEALTGRLPLPSGGSICIEPTRTLTAIDVNTGQAGKGRDAARTRLKANLEATEKIAWALRFLDIGGLVVIDFISMFAKADQKAVLETLDKALAGDPAAVQRSGFSRFGIVELARQKRGPSLLQRPATEAGGREGRNP